MVTSMATTIIVSRFPTVSRAIRPPKLYKYWWLRSPYTGSTSTGIYYAWRVDFFGDVGSTGVLSSVTYSYGLIKSPDLENEDNTAWFIGHNGSVRCTFDFGFTSYGFLCHENV